MTKTLNNRFLVALAAVTVALVMALMMSQEAKAAPADSDGHIPVVSSCFAGNAGAIYKASWYVSPNGTPYNVQGVIYLNECRLAELGAGPQDRQNVIAHEKAHARGWDHHEASPKVNPAYSPIIWIYGR